MLHNEDGVFRAAIHNSAVQSCFPRKTLSYRGGTIPLGGGAWKSGTLILCGNATPLLHPTSHSDQYKPESPWEREQLAQQRGGRGNSAGPGDERIIGKDRGRTGIIGTPVHNPAWLNCYSFGSLGRERERKKNVPGNKNSSLTECFSSALWLQRIRSREIIPVTHFRELVTGWTSAAVYCG